MVNSRSDSSATLTGNRPVFGPTGGDSDGFTSTSTVIPQISNNSKRSINKNNKNLSSSSTKIGYRNFPEEQVPFKSNNEETFLPSENEVMEEATSLSKSSHYSNIPQCMSSSSVEEDYQAQLVATGRRYDSRPYSTDGYTSSAMGGIVSSSVGAGGPGAYKTPTPTYEEYQQTPTRYNIARDGSLVSTGDFKINQDENLARLEDTTDAEQYYFNENYLEESVHNF